MLLELGAVCFVIMCCPLEAETEHVLHPSSSVVLSLPCRYSTNEGETWKTFNFSDSPLIVYGLLTEPGEKSTVFTIFGSYIGGGHSWVILQVNTSDVLGTNLIL